MQAIEKLEVLRARSGHAGVEGLPPHLVERFAASDARLRQAIDQALVQRKDLDAAWGARITGDEAELSAWLQEGILNFYAPDTVNPYVPLAGAGPWIVTTHGAVIHDAGGYGMLGFGHAPEALLRAMSAPYVMANVMTPSFSHRRMVDRLKAEVGHTRGHCPYSRFVFLNSGSEAVTLATRIADANARVQTDPGGRFEGREIRRVVMQGAFHGRTDRPARASHSSRAAYEAHLASFRGLRDLIVVEPNDTDGLRKAFALAESQDVFVEAVILEPVMGEGRPGLAIERGFYDAARELTRAHGSLLLVDSIQASLRAQGCLSLVDYPGFEDCDAPDMETYSKALNGGQFPLSVVGLRAEAAQLYRQGLYGNTMTANPRALEVGCAALGALTPELRQNIRRRGEELVEGLRGVQRDFPEAVLSVQGTGLLCAAELDPTTHPVVGPDGLETWCRRRGLGIIHGGRNALRLTPTFELTAAELELILGVIREAIGAFARA